MTTQTSSLVSDFRQSVEKRIEELAPQVTEHNELVELLASLDGKSASTSKPRPRARRGQRTGREPKRANEFLEIVKENPGITTTEVADKMGIKPNYLYRVAETLVERGELVKDGKRYRLS